MRLGGLILLLILSYFFNPIQPIVDEPVEVVITEIELLPSEDAEYLDASIRDLTEDLLPV